MNRFLIIDGLPYLYAGNKAYAVRWNEEGFTVGNEVKLAVIPYPLYSDIEIMAKCKVLDSIGEEQEAPEEQAKKSTGRRKKKAAEE